MSNGKGDKPRNNQSKQFRDNYDQIDWGVVDSKKRASSASDKWRNVVVSNPPTEEAEKQFRVD